MNPMNPWKVATVGLLLIGVTALSTGVTTAYFMRPNVAAPTPAASLPAAGPVPSEAIQLAPPAPAVRYVAAHPAPRPVVARAPRVVRASSVPVAADCYSTGDRVWRIAKPGAIGGLLGAGLGAAGGAIADGGKAAGKGALIGGIAGAVLGGGYGAYKTHNECGSVFGTTAGSPIFASR
ncbi:MAG TPA: hypothetical protein VK548_26825 [Candidatus Acidoferrum sp.]|nr:hypothetical protein [Candidatus Acidoferrum sp.]